jgi:cytochrome c553
MSRSAALAFALVLTSGTGALAQSAAERLPTCLACHGETGQSETPDVPSLGGQPPMYALIELFMFREKLRVVEPMNDMAAGLSDAELQTLADAIAKLPPPKPAEGADPARMQRGAALIQQHRCAFCHNNLKGADNVPRIAAQREDYLLKALREYKAGTRHEYQPVMAEVIVPLKDDDLVDLAHFLAHTGAP